MQVICCMAILFCHDHGGLSICCRCFMHCPPEFAIISLILFEPLHLLNRYCCCLLRLKLKEACPCSSTDEGWRSSSVMMPFMKVWTNAFTVKMQPHYLCSLQLRCSLSMRSEQHAHVHVEIVALQCFHAFYHLPMTRPIMADRNVAGNAGLSGLQPGFPGIEASP